MKKVILLLLALSSCTAFAQNYNENKPVEEKKVIPTLMENQEYYTCMSNEITKRLKVSFPQVDPTVMNGDKDYNDYVESLYPIVAKICESKIK